MQQALAHPTVCGRMRLHLCVHARARACSAQAWILPSVQVLGPMFIAFDKVVTISLVYLMNAYEAITAAMRDHTALSNGRQNATSERLTLLAKDGSTADAVVLALLSRCDDTALGMTLPPHPLNPPLSPRQSLTLPPPPPPLALTGCCASPRSRAWGPARRPLRMASEVT